MPLHIQRHDGWSALVLASPPRNELSVEVLERLASALDSLIADGAPVLLLKAEGRHFSTGYPIGEIPAEIFARDPDVRAGTAFETVMRGLSGYPAPIVAAVQGDAWGGAVELLACADIRVAAREARLGLTPARLGLIYSHTGLRRLLRGLGSPLLREMVFTGLPVAAPRLEPGGFFARVVEAEDLDQAAEEVISAILRGGPMALRGTRRVLHILEEGETLDESALAEIADLREGARSGPEFMAAQEAFLAKKPSPFGPSS